MAPITPKKFINKKYKNVEEQTACKLFEGFKESPDHYEMLIKRKTFGYAVSNDGVRVAIVITMY